MYPSNEDDAGRFHSPDEFETSSEKRTITGLEIGVIVGTVLAFGLALFSVFNCRRLESRRRAQRAMQQLERGQQRRVDVKESAPVATTYAGTLPNLSVPVSVWDRIKGLGRS